MRFFARTFNSFISVIVLQAVLVALLVSGSVSKSQEEDSRRELKTEALSVYDNFNSWKRVIWSSIVDLSKSERLKALIAAQTHIAPDNALETALRQAAMQAGCEFLVIRNSWSTFTAVRPLTDKPIPAPRAHDFRIDRLHPYVEMLLSDGILYFSGAVRVTAADGRSLDIFIAKRVDETLMRQLSFNSRVKALISLNSHFVVGSIAGTAFSEWMRGRTFSTSYTVVPELVEDGVPYGVVIQQSGNARLVESGTTGESTLYVCTFLSLAEYRARVGFINRSIILVSLIVALFTALLSLGLSKAVTDPVRQLRDAMLRLMHGEKPVKVAGPAKGEIADLFHGFNDMSARIEEDKRALSAHIQEITRIKEYNDKIFNSIREQILVINAEFSVEKANRAFFEFCEHSEKEVIGRNIDSLSPSIFDEPVHTSIRAVISGGLASDTQVRRTSSGRSFEIKFYPLFEREQERTSVHCIMVIEDITAKIAYEEKIRQAEKLSSISMLSAGVAHEINNPLSSILTNVQNLMHAEKELDRLEDLRIVEQETKRIARIVRNLLEFSSSPRTGPSETDINACIRATLRLLDYALKSEGGISIRTDLGASIPRAAIGEDECKQILLNLIKNALDAIGNSGSMRIETSFDAAHSVVQCSVADSGRGIPKELLPRVFDPFFSTKGDEGNSGLGLSVVYGLVSKFKGTIGIESEEGVGTTVHIALPAAGPGA